MHPRTVFCQTIDCLRRGFRYPALYWLLLLVLCSTLTWPAVPPAVAAGPTRAADARSGEVQELETTLALIPSMNRPNDPPIPLPRDCMGVTPPGEDPPACCIYGYVYYDGVPVSGASVTIESGAGTLSLTTQDGADSPDPYYGAALSGAPLEVSVGDLVTVRASYNGQTNVTTFQAIEDGQQVDVRLSSTCGPTPVGGSIATDTVWTQECAPYVASSGVLVEQGVTLTVESGVTVKFDAGRSLQIDGQLIAQGSESGLIAFTSSAANPVAGDWGYILFTDSSLDASYDMAGNYLSGSIIQYGLIEYAGGLEVSDNGALRLDAAAPFIDHSTVRYNDSDGIQIFNDAAPKVSHNLVAGNAEEGLDACIGGVLEIHHNTFSGNQGGLEIEDCDATADIAYNLFVDNTTSYHGGGMRIWDATVDVRHNIFLGNTSSSSGGGLYMRYSQGTVGHNVFVDNTADEGGGIYILGTGAGGLEISYNSLLGNQALMPGGAALDIKGGDQVGILYNTILSNTVEQGWAAVYVDDNPLFNYNNVYGNADYDLYNSNPQGSTDVNAENNWWGTTVEAEIQVQIYDWFDDSSLGQVDYQPFLSTPSTLAPVAPPTGLSAASDGPDIQLSWSANAEADLVGYRVYYASQPGFPYGGTGADQGDSPVDVGNATQFSLTGLERGIYYVAVTAYDSLADGENDQTDGNESWFSEEKLVQTWVRPQADFSATPRSGPAPLAVSFTDLSSGNVTDWSWDFGDGGTSQASNPNHTYLVTGVYTVALAISGPGGSDSLTRTHYITVEEPAPVQADFVASPTSGEPPLTVSFSDASVGYVDTWSWDFGDGAVSDLQNPQHTYEAAGSYTVSLSVSGPLGADVVTKPNYITVIPTYTTGLWTFMLYFAGDNNLHPYLEQAIDEMEAVANTPHVRVLVLWDGWASGDTRLYQVAYDTSPGITSPEISVDWNPGELNAGSSQVLVDFVNWARLNHPAEHYFLSLADHGRGTSGIAWDDTSGGDNLSAHTELESALHAISGGGSASLKLDLLFLDACLMGMIEDAYEVKEDVAYLVASENLGWSVFAYDGYVSSVTGETTPLQLAQNVADGYFSAIAGYPGTISALDMAALGQVGDATDGLAQALDDYLEAANISEMIAVRNQVQPFDSRDYGVLDSDDEYVDLYHLAELVLASISDPAVQSAAQAVMDAVQACVVAEHHYSGVDPWSGNYWDLDDAHGIALYYPPRSGGWDYNNYVAGGSWAFCSETVWDEFLVSYFAISGLPPETPVDPGVPTMPAPQNLVFLPIVIRGD